MPVLFLLPIRDPVPEGIEMIEAVSPRITPFQFRVRHAVADHGSGNLLRPTDRLLYAAKYLWYANMVAFRETGQGIMTGATYAALPYGPQLNNYADLVDLIREA